MLSEAKKSFKSVFDERLTSPLYGTLIISWLLWNWKIVYITIFVDEEKLPMNKLHFIEMKLSNPLSFYVLPLLSTAFLIGLAPYIANYAHDVSTRFRVARRDKTNETERNVMLTIDEGNLLRDENRKIKEQYSINVADNEREIARLKGAYSDLQDDIMKLRIVKAWWGAGKNWMDVESELTKYISNNKINISVLTNRTFSQDPAVGNPKILEVVYLKNNTANFAVFQEGTPVQIL